MEDSWLNSEGKLIEVGKFKHNEYAENLLIEEMGFDGYLDFMQENDFDIAYEALHERGWVRIKFNDSYLPRIQILGNCIGLTKPMKNTIDPAMNEQQIRVTKELCKKCDTDFNVAINDKRFW